MKSYEEIPAIKPEENEFLHNGERYELGLILGNHLYYVSGEIMDIAIYSNGFSRRADNDTLIHYSRDWREFHFLHDLSMIYNGYVEPEYISEMVKQIMCIEVLNENIEKETEEYV